MLHGKSDYISYKIVRFLYFVYFKENAVLHARLYVEIQNFNFRIYNNV